MKKRVLISIPTSPAHKYIHTQTTFALLKLQTDNRYFKKIFLPSYNPYENNLNHIARMFIDGNYDYWLNIDSDNVPLSNPLDLIELDKDICLLPYPQWHSTEEEKDKGDYPIVWLAMDDVGKGFKEHKNTRGLQKVGAGGSGGMLIARRVIKKMKKPFTRTFDKHGRVEIGVDFNFCRKARKAGFEVYTHFDYSQLHFQEIELGEVQQAFNSFYQKKYSKKKSSGKDLIFYCGPTREKWDGETHLKRGIAGSEESVIYLTPELVKLGWNVSVYNNCDKEKEINGVNWIPYYKWNRFDKQDVTVIWRRPSEAKQYINSDKVIVDLHDVGNKDQFKGIKVDRIFVKSEYHKGLYNTSIPMNIIPYGIKPNQIKNGIKKDPYLIVNTSAPDRGLDTLIKLFRKVKKQVPEAKLAWAYGWSLFDDLYKGNRKMMDLKDKMLKAMKVNEIENHDRITHKKVMELYQKAQIYGYPTRFPEVFCLSVEKAQAAGAIPITTDSGALRETNKGFVVKTEKEWIDKVVELLGKKQSFNYRAKTWYDVAKLYERII